MNLYKYEEKPISNKHMLSLSTYSKEEILQIISLALKLKDERKKDIPHPILQNKTLAMIFTKSSTRTRVSFEQGIKELGGYGMFLSSNDIQLGRGEPISDTAQVLSRMVHGIMIRTFAQSDVEDLAKYGTIPVINGLTDDYHPCQVLADIMTVYEHKKTLDNLKLSFFGDGNNMANSLMIICAKLGIDVYIACPKEYEPQSSIVAMAQKFAEETGSKVVVSQDIKECAADADVVYTDVFASMGQEGDAKARLDAMLPFQVNAKLMSIAKDDALFLHCLPAHRGEEVTAEVIDGKQSVVFDEAENRLHAQKALMALLMKDN
ncbi:MAG: ornithine carbamoyltransferase [Eubacteriales bacterium]